MPDRLDLVLADELELMRQFVALLLEENSALESGDLASIERCCNYKQGLITRLQQHAYRRLAVADSSDSQGFAVVDCSVLLSELYALAEVARRQNEVNGLIIQARITHNQQGLLLLQRKTAELYAPDGVGLASAKMQRLLGSA
jgi:flagellar biosynthesis/type III secretory pathway chaperone